MNQSVKIYKQDGSGTRYTAPICNGSVLKYLLMKEDYIRVKFNASELIGFKRGDYIVSSELNGLSGLLATRYVIMQDNNPTYDEKTKGYQYDLRLDAWYMELQNHIFMLPYSVSGIYRRREVSWTLTDKIEAHVRVWLINSYILGLNSPGGGTLAARILPDSKTTINVYRSGTDYVISKTESTGEKEVYFDDDAKYMQYTGNDMISDLGSICEKWGCEWWFDGAVLVIGRMQNSNTPYQPENGVDCIIKSSGSQGTIATRLYAYGSTNNIISSYRKKLVFNAGTTRTASNEITDPLRPLKVSMFRTQSGQGQTIASASRNGQSGYNLKEIVTTPSSWQYRTIHLIQSTSTSYYNIVFDNSKKVYVSQSNKQMSATLNANIDGNRVSVNASVDLICLLEISNEDLELIGDITCDAKLFVIESGTNNRVEVGTRKISFSEAHDSLGYYAGDNVNYRVMWYNATINFEEEPGVNAIKSVGMSLDDVSVQLTGSLSGKLKLYHDWCAQNVQFGGSCPWRCAQFTVKTNGQNYRAIINPDFKNYADTDSTKILLMPNGPSGTPPSVDDGQSWEMVTDEVYLGRIPAHYYTDDQSLAKNAVADVRLMLPEGTQYVDAVDDNGDTIITAQSEVIEAVEVFDDIYPQRTDTITTIKKHKYAETNTDDVTGEKYKEEFEAWQFVAQYASEDFSKDYELANGGGLFITFSSGDLAGMTFEVVWNKAHEGEPYISEDLADGTRNPEAKWFEILVNNEFGRMLPDDNLKPSVGDSFVMYGYDASYIQGNILRDAEDALLLRAKAHLQKLLHSDRTYTISLMPSYASTHAYVSGDLVKITTPNYFMASRVERVIGYEVCLDIPDDNPKYTVGENAIYSRIKAIEQRIKNN